MISPFVKGCHMIFFQAVTLLTGASSVKLRKYWIRRLKRFCPTFTPSLKLYEVRWPFDISSWPISILDDNGSIKIKIYLDDGVYVQFDIAQIIEIHLFQITVWAKCSGFCRLYIQVHLLKEKLTIMIQISLKSMIYNGIPSVRVMSWCRIGHKPLMMTSSNGNIVRVTGHLCGEFTGPRWIGQTPVIIILWCSTTKMFIKACFLIQPLEQEGGCQKYCISLCSKAFINHYYLMKASP